MIFIVDISTINSFHLPGNLVARPITDDEDPGLHFFLGCILLRHVRIFCPSK